MRELTDELKRAYDPTPVEVRWLFCREPAELENYQWLANALDYQLGGAHPMMPVPRWIEELTWVHVPTIECKPDKSPGFWRLHGNQREWYVTSEDLARACK